MLELVEALNSTQCCTHVAKFSWEQRPYIEKCEIIKNCYATNETGETKYIWSIRIYRDRPECFIGISQSIWIKNLEVQDS